MTRRKTTLLHKLQLIATKESWKNGSTSSGLRVSKGQVCCY
ncbi:hypothetical protein PF003_g24392 [Phytophthora fragariae]|nr:hypothetical protein PF003_g24392 [Phytophthora fragariae]